LLKSQSQKDLPIQLLLSDSPLEARIVIGSFGSTKPSVTNAFNIDVVRDPNQTPPEYKAPVRYGKLAEIHHIFRADPKSPPMIVSIVFALAVLATVPALLVGVCKIPTQLLRFYTLQTFKNKIPETKVANTPVLVDDFGREREPPAEGSWHCPDISRHFPWICHCHGGRVLPLLQRLDVVRNAACR
jgi:hypothetical protein